MLHDKHAKGATHIAAVIGIVCHADRSPKHKLSHTITDPEILAKIFPGSLAHRAAEHQPQMTGDSTDSDADDNFKQETPQNKKKPRHVILDQGHESLPKLISLFGGDPLLHHPGSQHLSPTRRSNNTLTLLTNANIHNIKFTKSAVDPTGRVISATMTCKWGGDITPMGQVQATRFAVTILQRAGLPPNGCLAQCIAASEPRVMETASIITTKMASFHNFSSPPCIFKDDQILQNDRAQLNAVFNEREKAISVILCIDDEDDAHLHTYLIGFKELLDTPGCNTPFDVVKSAVQQLDQLNAAIDLLLRSDEENEDYCVLKQRYGQIAIDISRPSSTFGAPFNCSKFSLLFDALTYDIAENEDVFTKPEIMTVGTSLLAVVRSIHVVMRSNLMGFNKPKKLLTSALVIAPLLRRIHSMIDTATQPYGGPTETYGGPTLRRIHSMIETAAPSSAPFPETAEPVPLTLFFTSGLVIDALRESFRESRVLQAELGEGPRREMYLADLRGFHYMTHLVIKVIYDSQKASHVELFLSSGAELASRDSGKAFENTVAPLVRIASLSQEVFIKFLDEICSLSKHAHMLAKKSMLA